MRFDGRGTLLPRAHSTQTETGIREMNTRTIESRGPIALAQEGTAKDLCAIHERSVAEKSELVNSLIVFQHDPSLAILAI